MKNTLLFLSTICMIIFSTNLFAQIMDHVYDLENPTIFELINDKPLILVIIICLTAIAFSFYLFYKYNKKEDK